MRARPKPLIGMVLGLLLALTVVALLTVLGVVAADQTIVWGLASAGMLLGMMMLTQRPLLAPWRELVVVVLAGVSAGVALGGLAQFREGGALTGGCYLTAVSAAGGAAMSPGDTTALVPFDVVQDDVVAWRASSDQVLTEWESTVGVQVGGADLVLWEGTFVNADALTVMSADDRVGKRLDAFEDTWGVPLTGTYHVVGTLDARQGSCELDLYVRVEPAGPLAGFLLVGLWAVAAVLILTMLVLAFDVRGLIRDADAVRRSAHARSAGNEPENGERDAVASADSSEPE